MTLIARITRVVRLSANIWPFSEFRPLSLFRMHHMRLPTLGDWGHSYSTCEYDLRVCWIDFDQVFGSVLARLALFVFWLPQKDKTHNKIGFMSYVWTHFYNITWKYMWSLNMLVTCHQCNILMLRLGGQTTITNLRCYIVMYWLLSDE